MRDALESWVVTLTRRTRALSARVPVVCVGGSVLGGTGKTPLAIAIAKHVAARGVRVALVGHAYRARPERARVARPDDDVRVVGDEALVCARALDGLATVVVGPDRQRALDLAQERADVLVVDGVLQLHPRRASLSILTVPETSTPPSPLVRATDLVTRVSTVTRASVPWDVLRQERVGLVTCLARPERVLCTLEARGIVPVVHVELPDHGPRRGTLVGDEHVDRWLATDKCVQHLTRVGSLIRLEPRSIVTLTCEAELSGEVVARVETALRLDRVVRAPYCESTVVSA